MEWCRPGISSQRRMMMCLRYCERQVLATRWNRQSLGYCRSTTTRSLTNCPCFGRCGIDIELASHVARAMSLVREVARARTGAGDVGEVDVVEFDNSSPGTKSPPLPQSPVGRRVVRTTTPPQDHVDHADDEGGRFISLLVRYPARVIGVARSRRSRWSRCCLCSAPVPPLGLTRRSCCGIGPQAKRLSRLRSRHGIGRGSGASPQAARQRRPLPRPVPHRQEHPPRTRGDALASDVVDCRACRTRPPTCRAFAQGNEALLAAVSAPGSASARRDAELLAQLNAIHGRAVGLTSEILSSSVIAQRGTTAELDVSDERAAYRIVRADTGALIESRPSRGVAGGRVTLEWINGAWLMSDAEVSEMAR